MDVLAPIGEKLVHYFYKSLAINEDNETTERKLRVLYSQPFSVSHE